MNYTPISALILLNIDVGDIFIYAVKGFTDTKYTVMVLITYALTMFNFLFNRLYVFPMYLIWHAIWFNHDHYSEVPGFWLMATFLHLLLALHVYWCVLIINLGIRFATTGKRNDTYVEGPDKPKIA